METLVSRLQSDLAMAIVALAVLACMIAAI
jgi:hypothetical protein